MSPHHAFRCPQPSRLRPRSNPAFSRLRESPIHNLLRSIYRRIGTRKNALESNHHRAFVAIATPVSLTGSVAREKRAADTLDLRASFRLLEPAPKTSVSSACSRIVDTLAANGTSDERRSAPIEPASRRRPHARAQRQSELPTQRTEDCPSPNRTDGARMTTILPTPNPRAHEKAPASNEAGASGKHAVRKRDPSASRTAGACGPSSGRTSCAPPYERRA